MPISITSNFDININKPIDSRLVATNSSVRDAIVFKYAGLKVYVLDEGRTYVYGTDSVWKVDGGSQNDQTGGIYGGSGSLSDDVGVDFGMVGDTLNDESNQLYFFSDTNNGDENYVRNYFYRNETGTNYDSFAYVIDNKIRPAIGSEIQSGYIDFNSQGNGFYPETGVLSLGTGDALTQLTKEPRLIISPRNYTEFKNSKGGVPFVIGNENAGETTLGVNYNPNTDNSSSPGYQAYIDNQGSGRFKMTSSLTSYQSRLANDVIWNDILVIDNDLNLNEVTSNLKIKMDTSAADWDAIVNRTSQLVTINEFIRNSEHRFTKTLYFNQGSDTATIVSDELILPSDGNSFEFTFTSARQIVKNIKIRRPGVNTSEFPNGSIIYVKFLRQSTSLNPYILIANSREDNNSSIYSKITDETFESIPGLTPPNNERLSILHTPPSKNGDLITFRKHNSRWEIVNIERTTKTISRTWSDTGPKNDTTAPWVFTSLQYLTSMSTPYRFIGYGSNVLVDNITSISSVTNNKSPNAFIYTTGTTNLFRSTLYSSDFQLKISNDGNRLVMVQGNFRITFGGVNVDPTTNFWINSSVSYRPNVWRIGRINSVNLLPQWETTWTHCSGYFYDKNSPSDIYTINELIFSISRLGDIMISFRITPPSTFANRPFEPVFDVYVPPFTYTSATYSLSLTGGGGVTTG